MIYQNITFKDLQPLLHKNYLLLDVRSDAEWNQCHLPEAVHLPLDKISLDSILDICANFRNEHDLTQSEEPLHLVFYCKSGIRSVKAIELVFEDYATPEEIFSEYNLRIYNLKGGITSLACHLEE